MGRLIIYDNIVQETLNAIVENKTTDFGLIIGQCTKAKDIAIRLCPTPMDRDVDPEDRDPEILSLSIDESVVFYEKWVCQHAKQLIRSLPGGLDILGMYVANPCDFTSKQQLKQQAELRQMLFAVYKTISNSQKLTLCSNERIFLKLNTVTSKMVCQTYDVTDYKAAANPAEWKLQSGSLKWNQLQSHLAVDVKFPIKTENSSLSLQKQIKNGLKPFLRSIHEAHVLVNGVNRESDDYLVTPSEGKRSKKKQSAEREDMLSTDKHEVEIFIPLGKSAVSSPEIFDCLRMMTFKGAAECRAYVHSKATVGEAINALKQDIIRSIIARCEIHCEDLLLIDEEQEDPILVRELPRRVYAPLPQSDICVCDYQFHSDTPTHSVEAFKDVLDLDVTEKDIDTSCEVSPTTSTLFLPDAVEDRLSEFGDTPARSAMNIYVPILGVVATLAVGAASYLIASQTG